MKRLIFILLICFIGFGTSSSYAYRTGKPVPINEINPNSLVELNSTLEEFWYALNGRYNCNVSSTIPTGTTATEGDIQAYYSGSTYRLYVFINGSWHFITFDN